MRFLYIMFFLCAFAWADFFPPTVERTVTGVSNNSISLSSAFPVNGMSGIVIHEYAKGHSAITATITQIQEGVKTIPFQAILHNNLPEVKTSVKVGDKVIGGYLYDTVLLLAPDASTYERITLSANKNWIHPDLYAAFLSKNKEGQPTKANLALFAQEYQVGLIYIVRKNSAVLYDPRSQSIVAQKEFASAPMEAQVPFFTRLSKIRTGWFSREAKGDYYELMEQLK